MLGAPTTSGSFVSDLLDAGSDLAAVQAFVGHRRPETTSRYDRRPELHVPYGGFPQ